MFSTIVDFAVKNQTHLEAWEFTKLISARSTVRCSRVDAYGVIQNIFNLEKQIDDVVPPDAPWALNLTDSNLQFRFLVFDLDDDRKTSDPKFLKDLETLSSILKGWVDFVVCDSRGNSSRRHVWVALTAGLDLGWVLRLTKVLKPLLPSLDLSCLHNPRTGAVRPPFSPHRFGGVSEVVSGDYMKLADPVVTPSRVMDMVEFLEGTYPTVYKKQETVLNEKFKSKRFDLPERFESLPTDSYGMPFFPGLKRGLPPKSRQALQTKVAENQSGHFKQIKNVDGSSVLFSVLCGAVVSRWKYEDVLDVVQKHPGLEHLRTIKQGDTRVKRPLQGTTSLENVFKKRWVAAAKYVFSSPSRSGHDDTFQKRAQNVEHIIGLVQEKLDSSKRRWTQGSNVIQRRVIDALCFFALQGKKLDVEADTRRLAITVGSNRETVRQNLIELEACGFIQKQNLLNISCRKGTVYKILPPKKVFHTPLEDGLSQVYTPPFLSRIERKVKLSAHSIFTPRLLGFFAGNFYASFEDGELCSLEQVAFRTGLDLLETKQMLLKLYSFGLLEKLGGSWFRPSEERCDVLARKHGLETYLQDRETRYVLERKVWDWWNFEVKWLKTAKNLKIKQAGNRDQQTAVLEMSKNRKLYGRFPRNKQGKPSFSLAVASF